METTKLYDQWRAMDDRRLANKAVSVRLPVHILARINAISDMFPTKTRTDIMTDLLKVGLEAFEGSLPPLQYSDEPVTDADESGQAFVEPVGVNADYRKKANEHYRQLEKELGTHKPANLFDVPWKAWEPS